MVIGVLQIELMIDGSTSLKDKRRVVKSLKDRLHREHMVSVAEVEAEDEMGRAVLGITMASNSVPHCQRTLDKLVERITAGRGYHVSDHDVQILTGQ
ncbi:MAG: DUF503 domain-containing protein, partial [Phycisphaeraceae bacterium]